ncbi:hypothetical protein niasHS_001621 [Heterodera schachtii]|uniref:C2H2-type domain-containing protein n=1 Tax=Heterodera schachtii TaxID=97005 RepID=A0ABD2KE35_HETSC
MGGFKGLKRCSFCDYSNKLSAQVRRHERQAHGENARQCTVFGCGQRVPYNRLARHIRECHSVALRAIDTSQTLNAPLAEEAQTDELAVLGQKQKRMEEEEEGKKQEKKMGRSNNEKSKEDKEEKGETEKSKESGKESAQDNDGEENSPSSVLSSSSTSSSSSASVSQMSSSLSVGVVPIAQLALGQHECANCGQRKPTREALRRHIARVHEKRYMEPKREKRHHCEWEGCGKSFTTRGKLEDHVNGHTGNCPFSCDHCTRNFVTRAEFLRHLRKYHAVSIRQMGRQIEQIVDFIGQ